MESSAEVEKMLGEGLDNTGPYHGPTAAIFWTGGVIAVLRDAIQEAKKASGAHIFRPLLGTLLPSPFQATGKKGRDCQSRGLPLNLGRLSNFWEMQNCVQAVVPETIADLKRASTKLFAGFVVRSRLLFFSTGSISGFLVAGWMCFVRSKNWEASSLISSWQRSAEGQEASESKL